MEFKFEKLTIWQKAMTFGEEIHHLACTFPREELFNLSSQIRRAADSIAVEYIRGCYWTDKSRIRRFMSYAIRSMAGGCYLSAQG